MKILITGGLGRIGSYLYEILSQKDKIVILDNFSNINKDKIDLQIIK